MLIQRLITMITVTIAAWMTPLQTHAVALLPECASGSGFGNCSTCDFLALFANASEIILQFIGVAVLATLVIGGALWILSAGNDTMVQKGKSIIIGSVIGTLLVLGSYFIVNAVIASLIGDGDFENVKVFGNTNWSDYCTDPNPEPQKESAVTPSSSTDPAKACAGKTDGVECSTTTCKDHCVCAEETCVSFCEDNYFGQDASCVANASSCSGINGGAGLCPDAKPYCCVEDADDGSTTETTDTGDIECDGLGAGDSCETDACTDGCVCNDVGSCVNYCEYLNNGDTTQAMCTTADECLSTGGSSEMEGVEAGCSDLEVCCVFFIEE